MRNWRSILVLLALLGAGLWFVPFRRAKPLRFEDTVRIVFTMHPKIGTWVIEKPAEVAAFVREVKLEPNPPCACMHRSSARFVTAKGDIEVSFCDHCFDVRGRKTAYYQMPTNFYALVLRSAPGPVAESPSEPPAWVPAATNFGPNNP